MRTTPEQYFAAASYNKFARRCRRAGRAERQPYSAAFAFRHSASISSRLACSRLRSGMLPAPLDGMHPCPEFLVGAAQCFLRIELQVPPEIDQREQHVAELVLHPARIVAVDRLAQFGDLLLDLVEDRLGASTSRSRPAPLPAASAPRRAREDALDAVEMALAVLSSVETARATAPRARPFPPLISSHCPWPAGAAPLPSGRRHADGGGSSCG